MVTLTGTGLDGATAVKFHGTSASFSVASATQITATVPAGATTGTVSLTTPGGSATSSASYTVTGALQAKPVLIKLSPVSGKRSATVTITGKNLGKRSGGYVTFGSARCTKYVSWSSTRIKCRVPEKARFGRAKVVVVTAAGSSNAKAFTVKH